MIRVLVAEDQNMVLGALAALLDLDPGIEVVGRAMDGAEALRLVRGLKPDVLVSDIEMPKMSGLDIARCLHQDRAATRVLIVTTFGRPGYLRQVLRLAEEGRSSKEIARSLGISPGTTRNYLSEASQKLGASSRIEAARIARARGWL